MIPSITSFVRDVFSEPKQQSKIKVLRHFWGNPICKTPLSMDYASLFEGINIQCYKMELKKM